ncbi:hypothetical protein O9992_12885 [Vibrio lentus]|nr:hypothetical protein [Vibrio lentus]
MYLLLSGKSSSKRSISSSSKLPAVLPLAVSVQYIAGKRCCAHTVSGGPGAVFDGLKLWRRDRQRRIYAST